MGACRAVTALMEVILLKLLTFTLFSLTVRVNVCICVYMCLWRPKEGVQSLEVGDIGGCEPPDKVLGPLEQGELLAKPLIHLSSPNPYSLPQSLLEEST